MRVIAFLFRYSPGAFLLAVLAGLTSGGANTGLLAVVNSLLTDDEAAVASLVWTFGALCLVLPLARFSSELLVTYLGQNTIYRMRMEMCGRILTVPLRQLEILGAPRLLAILTADIPAITNVATFMPTLFINVAIVIGSLVYLGLLSWQLSLAALGLVALGMAGYQLLAGRARRHFRRAREAQDRLYQTFRAVIEGIKELKLHRRRRQAFLDGSLEAAAAVSRRDQIQAQRLYAVASSWGQLLAFVGIGLLLFASRRSTTSPVDLATLTGYTLVLLFLITPLQMIMDALPQLARAQVALARVEDIARQLERQANDQHAGPQPAGSRWKSLELSGVTHLYRQEGKDEDFVLGPIDLRLEAGEIVLLAGGNGSGKTTLAKILVGLYLPASGEIRMNGEPTTDANRQAYREHFSAIFSDFYLFEDLIGLDAPDVDEQARHYLGELQIAHKVTIRDGRLSSTELSQGQRKRLALLTAYLEDRPIYLFDEWAADQDPMFKEIFYLQILPDLKRRGKACVVISHDDRYYAVADRVVKLDYGRITEVYRPGEVERTADLRVRCETG